MEDQPLPRRGRRPGARPGLGRARRPRRRSPTCPRSPSGCGCRCSQRAGAGVTTTGRRSTSLGAAADRADHHRARGQRRHRQDLRARRAGHPLRRRGHGAARRHAADHLQPRGQPGAARAGPRPAGRARPRRSTTRRRADDDLLARTWSPARDEELAERAPQRLRDALAGFDAATIATTHQFCQLVLRSLGVAGDTDAGVDPGREPRRAGRRDRRRPLPPALRRREGHPGAHPRPGARARRTRWSATRAPGSPRSTRPPRPRPACAARSPTTCSASSSAASGGSASSASTTCCRRLAVALEADDAPARDRMRRRWSIVMVDEFQDTDPVQWEVIERAFAGQVTLVLIGDPKQAIYAFRGGDVVTYLRARERADALLTLDTNYRSDAPLVERLLRGPRRRRARPRRHRGPRRSRADRDDPPARRAPRPTTRSGCAWSRATPFGIRGTRHHPDGRPAPLHRRRPRRRHQGAARLRRDVRRPAGSAPATSPSSSRATATPGPAATRWPPPACRPSTPATPTSSPRRPRPTGSACSRRSSSPAAPGWCAPRRPRCSSAAPPPSSPPTPRPHRRGRRDAAALGRPRPGPRHRGGPRGGVRRRHGRAGARRAQAASGT